MDKLVYDSPRNVDEKYNRLKKAFSTHKSKDLSYRLKQLKILKAAIKKYEKEMNEASHKDLGQSEFYSFYTNTASLYHYIDNLIDNIQEWAKPRYTEVPVLLAPATSYVIAEPYGIVLVMGAWNFNFSLSLIPCATAIAAGNVVLLKPSEMSPYAAKLIEKMCKELDEDVVQICHGERETCEALLSKRWDLIFFTGSPQKGKLVSRAAAEFLTPCILELGGQNPCIVDKTCSLTNVGVNIISGRFGNSGQVCLCPEYVFVESSIMSTVVDELKKNVINMYTNNPKKSEDYARIINEWHADRLSKLIKNPGKGAKLVQGGDFNVKERYVEPTIFEFTNFEDMRESDLAKEEIFGPILYLVPYTNLDDVVDYINSKEKPLAMYYFGNNYKAKETLVQKTSSGALMTNDVIVHYGSEFIPFGGVGMSGYGSYHGKWGFDNLSHLKPVFDRTQYVLWMRFPPYAGNEGKMKFLLNNLHYTQYGIIKFLLLIVLFIVMLIFRKYLMFAGNTIYNKLVA